MDGLAREEDLHQAVERLTAHIGGRPDDVEALSARELLYVELGEHRRAVEDYSRVIDLAPGDSYAYFHRARAHAQLGEHRSAVDDYGIAIRLDPDDPVARYNRGASSAERLLGHRANQVIGHPPHTVRNHIRSARSKLKERNRLRAVLHAKRSGLL